MIFDILVVAAAIGVVALSLKAWHWINDEVEYPTGKKIRRGPF